VSPHEGWGEAAGLGSAIGSATVSAASGRRVTETGMALVVTLSLVAGCSSDDDSRGDGDDGEVAGVELDAGADTPSETHPPAERLDEVYPHVVDLLASYDELVEEIVADPAALDSPGDDVDDRFLALFSAENAFARASLDGWEQLAADDVRLEPASSEHPLNFTYLDGGVQQVGDDGVRFAHCTVQRYVRYEGDDETDRTDEPVLLPGQGTAVRVDGRWLLDTLETPPGLQGCTEGDEGP